MNVMHCSFDGARQPLRLNPGQTVPCTIDPGHSMLHAMQKKNLSIGLQAVRLLTPLERPNTDMKQLKLQDPNSG